MYETLGGNESDNKCNEQGQNENFVFGEAKLRENSVDL